MRRILAVAAISLMAALAAPMPASSAPAAPAAANYRMSASLITSKGTNYVRMVVAGGTGSESIEVGLYGYSFIPEPTTITEERKTVVGTVKLSGGRGTIDVAVTGNLLRKAQPQTLLHVFCCSAWARKPGTTALVAAASVANGPGDSYYGPVVASSTTLYLDLMSRLALGHALDDPATISWAAKMSAGTSRVTVSRAIVGSLSWRRYRAITLYQSWLGRRPTASEQAYWEQRLATGTTSAADLALGGKPAARDAGGTTNAQRGAHLAAALHLPASYGRNYAAKLDGGTPWTTVVHDAYWSAAGLERRIKDMGPTTGYTPSVGTLAGKIRATGDEREAQALVLATLPNQRYL